MPLPPAAKVKYRKNPLVELTCQVGFPAILRIEAEPPVQFQERLRDKYPQVQMQRQMVDAPGNARNVYRFASADGLWAVGLTSDSAALSASKCERWDEMGPRLVAVLEALAIYKPGVFSRISLRSRYIIDRSELGLQDTPWAKLLKPQVAAELGWDEVQASIKEAFHRVMFEVGDRGARVRLQHGLAENPAKKEVYLIETDLYTEQPTEPPRAQEVVRHLDAEGGRVFRASVSDVLHNALGPEPGR